MTITAHRWLAPVLLTAALINAQEPAPAAPARPLLEIELDGPAQVRTALLPTNLGSRLASQEARELWAPLQRMLATLLAEAGIEGEAAADLERQVLAYGGRMRLTLDVDDVLAEQRTGRLFDLPLLGALRLRPDGHTDLAALGRAVASIMKSKIVAPPAEVTAGERRLQTLRVAPGLDASLPEMIDGELVVFLGTDIARAVTQATAVRAAPDTALAGSVLAIRADLARAVTLAARRDFAGSERQAQVAERFFGMRALRDAHLLVSAAGPQVMVELNMGFGEGPRGLFDALFPDRPGLPKLIDLLPEGADSWKAGRFDLQSFVATLLDVIGLEMENRKEMEQSMRDQLGFDLQTDMIAHTGDSYLVLGSSWMSGDEDAHELDGACLAFALDDAAAFAPRWKKVCDLLAVFADDLGSSEHRDVSITTWRWPNQRTMSFAVSRGLLLLGWGDDGLARLQAIIEREAQARPDAAPKPPADVARVLRSAPPGFNGCAVTSAKGPFSKQMTQLLQEAGNELPNWLPLDELLLETRKHLRPLLDQPGLERVVTLTGYAQGRWRLRLLW